MCTGRTGPSSIRGQKVRLPSEVSVVTVSVLFVDRKVDWGHEGLGVAGYPSLVTVHSLLLCKSQCLLTDRPQASDVSTS